MFESRLSIEELEESNTTLHDQIIQMENDILLLMKEQAKKPVKTTTPFDLFQSAEDIKFMYEVKLRKFKQFSKVYGEIVDTIRDSTDDYKKILETIGVEEVPNI